MTTRPGYVWDNTALEWVTIGPVALPGSNVFYQASAPATPATGDIWIDSDDDVPSIDSSVFYRWKKTAVGGETTLSGADDNGLALKYTPGYEELYINGVLQVRGSDYVATTGNTITGLTALVAGDIVTVMSQVAYTVGDTYTQTAADAKFYSKTSSASSGEASTVNINTKPWNIPWGTVGYVTYTGISTVNSSTLADVVGMTKTFTGVAGRLYKATYAVSQAQGTSGERGRIHLTGTNISGNKSYYFGLTPSTAGFSGVFTNVFTASASGSTTVKVQFCRDVGSNVFTLYADSGDNPMQLLIEDIGPV